jgi:hypothetical protein
VITIPSIFGACILLILIGQVITIPSIPYGRTGSFAISLWFKRATDAPWDNSSTTFTISPDSGVLTLEHPFEYLYSHSNAAGKDPAFSDNQAKTTNSAGLNEQGQRLMVLKHCLLY